MANLLFIVEVIFSTFLYIHLDFLKPVLWKIPENSSEFPYQEVMKKKKKIPAMYMY